MSEYTISYGEKKKMTISTDFIESVTEIRRIAIQVGGLYLDASPKRRKVLLSVYKGPDDSREYMIGSIVLCSEGAPRWYPYVNGIAVGVSYPLYGNGTLGPKNSRKSR